ncbi:MAG: porin family protein [Mediterranea sp.]|nr:porin family protein [Mediterranea sp.]
MKQENDDITRLFRTRLGDAEMPVRDGFWEKLETDIPLAGQRGRRLLMFRVAAAASVLLVLAGASTAFWYFSPKEEMRQAFHQINLVNGANIDGDGIRIQPGPKPTPLGNILPKPRHGQANGTPAMPTDTKEDSIAVSFSFSISFSASAGGHSTASRPDNGYWPAANAAATTTPVAAAGEGGADNKPAAAKNTTRRRWALKAEIGTTLPAQGGNYKMPITAGATIERQLTPHVGIESGLLYSNLRSAGQKLHYIGIPLRANFTFVNTRKVDLYATVGGIAEKCVAGAPDNGFGKEPIQLAVTGGVGIRYKLNDRLALFAEPGVSHYFPTDSSLSTVRTKRPTNLNLLCGLRMTY